MTSISHPLAGRANAPSVEKTAGSAFFECAGLLPILLLRGVGLGFVGLAVVLTVTAALIGVHEIQQDDRPTILPTQIRPN